MAISGMVDGVLDTDRSYPIPKTIKNHPGVEEALDGPGQFNTVADFRNAQPRKVV